jgi:hypothetical protein
MKCSSGFSQKIYFSYSTAAGSGHKKKVLTKEMLVNMPGGTSVNGLLFGTQAAIGKYLENKILILKRLE